jgi:dienelactone hydrolase
MERDLVSIKIGKNLLEGSLKIPQKAKGVVLFAHGSGSGRHSPRNQFVAQVLREGGIGTLLIDLLTEEEERVDEVDAHLRFDIQMLTKRVISIVDWLHEEKTTKSLTVGLFGASTGAAAALGAAAERKNLVKAVVSRGGRPDLAMPILSKVAAPTLLIVGGHDYEVIRMNEEALQKLRCEKKLTIVPDATHLFEEKGTLEEAAKHARDWFLKFL